MKKVTFLLVGLVLIWSAPASAVPFMVGNTQTLVNAGYAAQWASRPLADIIDLTPVSSKTGIEFKSEDICPWIAVLSLYDECGGADDEARGVTAPVPEPATMLLFGSGLVGLAVLRKRIKK